LNDCNASGGTTFPLALRINHDESVSKNLSQDEPTTYASYTAKRAADHLIFDKDVQHTRITRDDDEDVLKMGKEIEDLAVQLFLADNDDSLKDKQESAETGVRVMPKCGHICLFSTPTENGFPNPRSFHGGEVLFQGEHKNLLSFFFEIPGDTFSSRFEFGQLAKKREDDFLKWHNIDC